MIVRLTQIDGALPNLALMKLASFHKAKGDVVHFTRQIEPDLFEPAYDVVYGSAIFDFSADRVEQFRHCFPRAIIGGTGSGNWTTVEEVIGQQWDGLDYDSYPEFTESFGFTQRGCRLRCSFCVVPTKEGKPRSVSSIHDIWRGDRHPRKIHLLDNDFFGQPEADWKARVAELRDGNFRVCFGQGINLRILNEEQAAALASVEYRDTKFQRRRLYTAWDNLKDERIFFRGVDLLEKAGVPPSHLRTYMLVGFDPLETWDRLMHRFNRMVERGIEPYPMVYNAKRKDLKAFQRWVVTGLYRAVPWESYNLRPQHNAA
jgi:hypothetical protein